VPRGCVHPNYLLPHYVLMIFLVDGRHLPQVCVSSSTACTVIGSCVWALGRCWRECSTAVDVSG
jgi:hypothetical protein